MSFSLNHSLTRNSIYSIHSSYYSIDLAFTFISFIIISWLILWPAFLTAFLNVIFGIVFGRCVFGWFIVLLLIWLTALNWMNDFCMESFLALTGTEQFSLIYGIKWLIVSECMLFFACFWSFFNFRVISTGFSLFFSLPLFFAYSFGIPFSNLLILLFSGVPIQAAQLFLKIGFLINTIEGVAQCLSCGWLFIILQLKEFLYSYFSLSDVMIGSIFYFTTGLHGFHVVFGSFGFFLTLWLILSVKCIGSINIIWWYSYYSSLCSLSTYSYLYWILYFICYSFYNYLFGYLWLNHSLLPYYFFVLLFNLTGTALVINFLCLYIDFLRNIVIFWFFSWYNSLLSLSILCFSYLFSSSFLLLFLMFFIFNLNPISSFFNSLFYFPLLVKELSMSFFLLSFYWHFVDWIWFLVFLFLLLLIFLFLLEFLSLFILPLLIPFILFLIHAGL